MTPRYLFRSLLLPALTCIILLASFGAPLASRTRAQAETPTQQPTPVPISNTPPAPSGDHQLSVGPVAWPTLASRPQQPTITPNSATTLPGLLSTRPTGAAAAATRLPTPTLDMKLLVLSADGQEPALLAIRQALSYLGVPATEWIATQHLNGLTANVLFDGTHGFYNGIILATGGLGYSTDGGNTYLSALSASEWQTLWDYETAFGVRQASWYTMPTADYGFGGFTIANTDATPLSANLTPAGQAVFMYVNPASIVTIRNAYTYLAMPLDSATTPLLVDVAGHALAAVRAYPDGRENLALTFDSNPHLLHTIALSYGVINWVSHGLFLGERHVYLDAQPDDVFIANAIWTEDMPCGTDPETSAEAYRITGADLQNVVAWQGALHTHSTSHSIRFEMPFNAEGVTGLFPDDTLTVMATQLQANFKWISHTFTHRDMENVDAATVEWELNQNHIYQASLGLQTYSKSNLITPGITGLDNPTFLQAAYALGVRYVVSDTSKPGQNNPSPNAGISNALQPGILMIPRRPTNLFYNVSTPTEWVAEYNCLYRSYWGRDLTYEEILDKESDVLVVYLLLGENDPWMFHQPNLRAYDGTHMLLGDLIDRTLEKYNQLYTLPIQSPTQDELGRRIADRMAYNQSSVTASYVPGQAITLHVAQAATIPVTGLQTADAEQYGGQAIAYISLSAGQTITLPLAANPTPGPSSSSLPAPSPGGTTKVYLPFMQ